MISLYRPGTGILQRMPAGAKLAVLAAAALVLSLLRPGILGTAVVLALVSSLYPVGGVTLRALGEAWWRLRWLIGVMTCMGALFGTAILYLSRRDR